MKKLAFMKNLAFMKKIYKNTTILEKYNMD